MNGLPENWELAPIGLLCTLVNGRAFKPSDWTNSGIPIVRIQNLNNPHAPYNYYDKDVDNRFLLKGEELLFAWSGTPGTSFGAHIWRGGAAVLNQHIFRVDFDEALIDKRFFRYAINQKLDELINMAQGGVGLRHITKGVFENTQVVVPPFNEQKRIAHKLDALLAWVDSCQEHLERIPQILKRFRQSVLAAATSGRLTREWRESNSIKFNNWEKSVFAAVCTEITVGHVGKMSSEYRPEGIPFLRSLNVRPLYFDPRDLKFVSPEFHKRIKKSALKPGDVVVVRSGAPGQSCVIPDEVPEANCSDLVIVRTGPKLVPQFASIFINSEVTQSFIRAEQVGVAQQHFNVGSMKKVPISLPTLDEQNEIVRRVDSLFTVADFLESHCQVAQSYVSHLTPSLLAKAFRGELVEQDPNDEPASVLLDKIRAQRAIQPDKPNRVPKTSKPREAKMTEDTVQEIIQKLPQDRFSFDELRAKCPGDYEQLKEILFALLGKADSGVTQTFDQTAKAMHFVRGSK